MLRRAVSRLSGVSCCAVSGRHTARLTSSAPTPPLMLANRRCSSNPVDQARLAFPPGVLSALEPYCEDINVKAILGRKEEPVCIPPDMLVLDAIRLMEQKRIGAVLVANDKKELLGVFTERDYLTKVILRGYSSKDTEVRQIMSVDPITVPQTATIFQCMYLMNLNRFRHLPVLGAENKVIGIVSIGDIVKELVTQNAKAFHDMQRFIDGNYSA